MRQHPPDLVFAFCSGMMRFAMLPPLDTVPCILDMVDADSAKWDDLARIKPAPARWIYAREARCLGAFEARAMRHARATLVVNARERDILRRHSPMPAWTCSKTASICARSRRPARRLRIRPSSSAA